MKVVIIDDSVSSLAAMSEYVRGLADAECVSFTRAMPALNWLEGNPVDLVVVDYLMPGIDGLDFIARFRQLPNQDGVPIVMVTASNLRHVRYMALQMGATDFLTKPVDPVEFTVRITNLLTAYATHKALECHLAELSAKVARATADLAEREREALFFIGRTAEHRDVETGKHLLRMSTYSWLIAQAIGLPEDEAHRLRLASPLHDVGKVAIPDEILLKPGMLTDAEYTVMKRHAQLGADILSGSRSPLLQLACEIAFTHHEKFDGSGYPRHLAGCDIPLSGRIVAVADVFDALSNARPYKRPWSFDDSHRYLQAQAGSHFDPDCVDAFTRMIDRVREVYELNRE